jgi:hypothetical protein
MHIQTSTNAPPPPQTVVRKVEARLLKRHIMSSAIASELSVRSATVTPAWWGLLVLLRYRTWHNYTSLPFLAARLADKVAMGAMIMTLYWGTGGSLEWGWGGGWERRLRQKIAMRLICQRTVLSPHQQRPPSHQRPPPCRRPLRSGQLFQHRGGPLHDGDDPGVRGLGLSALAGAG